MPLSGRNAWRGGGGGEVTALGITGRIEESHARRSLYIVLYMGKSAVASLLLKASKFSEDSNFRPCSIQSFRV